MVIILYVFVYLLKLVYFCLKLLPTKNKIVFISRQTDKPSLDFRRLAKEIGNLDKNIEIVFVTKKMKKNIIDGIRNVFNIFIQMYHLATSKVCITDGYNIPISVLKHKNELKVFQLWHSLGAIKKFGYQTLNTNKSKKIAKVLKMHKNYDYITCSSKEMIKYFSKSFNYKKKNFVPIGLPRIDYLLKYTKRNKKKIYTTYPEFKNKKIILYAPTFRDNDNYKINELINTIDLKKHILIIKVHPNMNYKINYKNNVYTCEDYTSLQLLSVANYVITDYSGFSIEASVLEKPVYLYVYDLKEYGSNPGINLDLKKELPGYVFEDANLLYKKLINESYDMDVIKKYKSKYVTYCDGTVTRKLAMFILEKGFRNEENNN